MSNRLAKVIPLTYVYATVPAPEITRGNCTVSYPSYVATPRLYKKSAGEKAITCREVSKYEDKCLYRKWMARNLCIPENNKELQTFLYASDKYIYNKGFVKSFLVSENEKPLTFIDLVDATQHEVSLYYKAQKGDYNVELHDSPDGEKAKHFVQDLFGILIEFLFMAPFNVNRIIIDIEKIGVDQNWMAGIAFGFVTASQIQTQRTTLFITSRESFFKVQLQSCLENRIVEIQFCKDRNLNRKFTKTNKLTINGGNF